MDLTEAGSRDAAMIASLRHAVAVDLTERFGRGHWSRGVSPRGVLSGMRYSRVYTARSGGELLGVLRLTTRKPWAIDPDYFTPVSRPLYLTDMAVAPPHQGKGVGRWLLARALKLAEDWPADAVRLDAYDAEAGGGGFYERCGFREVGRCQYRRTPLIFYETLVGPRP